MNGIEFHTWFVQAHLISSLFLKISFTNVNIWMKFFFVLIFICYTNHGFRIHILNNLVSESVKWTLRILYIKPVGQTCENNVFIKRHLRCLCSSIILRVLSREWISGLVPSSKAGLTREGNGGSGGGLKGRSEVEIRRKKWRWSSFRKCVWWKEKASWDIKNHLKATALKPYCSTWPGLSFGSTGEERMVTQWHWNLCG